MVSPGKKKSLKENQDLYSHIFHNKVIIFSSPKTDWKEQEKVGYFSKTWSRNGAKSHHHYSG